MYKIDFSHPQSLYFVGIGGVSMSGLAELLADAGFRVSGSDRAKSPFTQALEAKGITVFYGQRAENITEAIDCVIFTSAISEDNPEYIAAHQKNLPCLTRGQLLGQVMQRYHTPIAVSGTHGKTTVTSMVTEILLKADTDPTIFLGGMLDCIGGNVRLGKSGYLVTEACEYTNSFLSFYPKIEIILNIEEDHMDFFKDLDDIRHSFRSFADRLPVDGCLIVNSAIENLPQLLEGLDCRIITFNGSSTKPDSDADYYADNITYNALGHPTFSLHSPDHPVREITLRVPGAHNISNALAAVALADLLDIEEEITSDAISSFGGVHRRFEYKGTVGGVSVIDDYAHHPTEITATLNAAAKTKHNTLWCVFQPHTYTRTHAFLKDFAKALSLADKVVLADIYAAREQNTLGISSKDLQREIQVLGKECHYFPTFDEIENFLLENCINGDMLITMGAGDVYKIGENLLGN